MSRERTSGSTGRSLSNVFNVYHGRDKKPENKYTWCWWRPFDWPSAQAPWPPKDQKPQGPSFKCGLEGHWAWACLNSHKPPGYVQVPSRRALGCWLPPCSSRHEDIKPRSPPSWFGHGLLMGPLLFDLITALWPGASGWHHSTRAVSLLLLLDTEGSCLFPI